MLRPLRLPRVQSDAATVMDPEELDDLVTEARAGAPEYEAQSTRQLVELMNSGDRAVPDAVGAVSEELARAVDAIAQRMRAGGRLLYVGAGTSGRLAQLDAEECESTFSADPGQIVAIAATRDADEDDAAAGRAAIEAVRPAPADAVVAVSASGRTPFVLGATEAAGAAGSLTVAVVSARDSALALLAELEIPVVVGPEFVAGSTRLKAGTAQKLVLNTISTITMIRLGKTYGDLMVDVAGRNEKQRARASRAVRLATDATPDEADEALAAASGSAKVAIVSLLTGLDAESARARLELSGGSVREALR